MMIRLVPSCCLAVLLTACAGGPGRSGVALYQRTVTAGSPVAQREFATGLLYCYGFNHDEAVRHFEAALAADPGCAMACWGIAYALGPNINKPLTEAAVAARAHAMAQQAQRLAANCQPVEQALIGAMQKRYADPPPQDRTALDRAFADAMRDVWRAHPDDPDVGAVFAESMLDLAPWNQWTADGKPRPGTEEILATLERVLAGHPDHPMALHLYIHATEASPFPEKGIDAAERLPRAAPGLGHLVHMPAHVWQRTGRYADAVRANLDGAAIDAAYFAAAGPQGFYHGYHAHNLHFAAYSAMFLGDSKTALTAARQVLAVIPPGMLQAMPELFDGWVPVPLHVLIRFGRWREVLDEPEPGQQFPVARAMWHYARGVAATNLGELDTAAAEQAAFEAAAKAVPAAATVGLTPAAPVLEVARGMLAGELTFRRGDRAAALARLREAVAAEDGLPYDEPSGWMMPVRHSLGALLLEDGRAAEAEAVYREDLKRHPENGWALFGLAECLRQRSDPEASRVEARFHTAWAKADIDLVGSCFCRRPAASAPRR